MGVRTGLALAGMACALLAGCALLRGAPPGAPDRERPYALRFEPEVVVGDPRRDADIERYNEEELVACGTSAFAAAEYDRAARCFTLLADRFPASRHRDASLYNAGLSYERLSQWELAIERFRPLMDLAKGTGDAVDAAFRVAECYYHLDNYPPAVEILDALAARTDLPVDIVLQATTQRGICELEGGQLDRAEKSLRQAMKRYDDEKDKERLDDYFPAQAQFFLGEVYRVHFSAITLDPNAGQDKTAQHLEAKCQLLLSAQGHYLRAIRIGNGQWATAAGFRVGALYEDLYDHLVHAPVPAELDADQAELYRRELRKKVQILVTKAIAVYERTLSAAERIGVDSLFVKRTQEALERMKGILLADANQDAAGGKVDGGPGAASPPAKEAPLPGTERAPDKPRARVPAVL